ncbi:hypothetical protein HY450_01090 [Candidatus Pacearchaeota archaeon]|nr:hypothetical protein [Candidatus Pacearchaeota archaeon]
MLLKKIHARKIKDSRGEQTIEIFLNGVKASSPSGKSKGKHETPSYHNSLGWNIKFLNSVSFNIEINHFNDLKKLELFIKKKTKLSDIKLFGANALFALECSVLKSLAKEKHLPLYKIINQTEKKLPVPVGNAIGGGLHSHNENHPVFQEFLLIPKEKSSKENYKTMKKIYEQIRKIISAKEKNDEGAWQTSLSDEEVLEILSRFKDVRIGIDVAASSFYKSLTYNYKNKFLDRITQISYINFLIKKFNLFYIEDPLQEEDFEGFSKIDHSPQHLVVGDDLTATQISRIKKAISYKSINAMIIKPNQNGSLIELKQIFDICKKHRIKTILSHRSGETLDNALADLAVGFQADFIKCGIATKWREAKLERLVEIERSLKK